MLKTVWVKVLFFLFLLALSFACGALCTRKTSLLDLSREVTVSLLEKEEVRAVFGVSEFGEEFV